MAKINKKQKLETFFKEHPGRTFSLQALAEASGASEKTVKVYLSQELRKTMCIESTRNQSYLYDPDGEIKPPKKHKNQRAVANEVAPVKDKPKAEVKGANNDIEDVVADVCADEPVKAPVSEDKEPRVPSVEKTGNVQQEAPADSTDKDEALDPIGEDDEINIADITKTSPTDSESIIFYGNNDDENNDDPDIEDDDDYDIGDDVI